MACGLLGARRTSRKNPSKGRSQQVVDGTERVPTPRIPVTAARVVDMLSEIASTASLGDGAQFHEVVGRISALSKESESNRRCIASSSAGAVLSAAFASLARDPNEPRVAEAKEEILASLTRMFPLGEDACSHLGSPESLLSLVGVAQCGDSAGRLNAVLAVKQLLYEDRSLVDVVANTHGMAEALDKLIREPISTQATKASLVAIFYLVSSNEKAASRFADMGLVPLLLEILVTSDKSVTEKALGVLDGICTFQKGRQAAYEHALTTPVLVKKIIRVSGMATEFSVSALWKLCKKYGSEGKEDVAGEGRAGCLVEALQVGAFQKLLLLLQVGCGEATKGLASALLKLLNASRWRPECVDSTDFKGLKRPL